MTARIKITKPQTIIAPDGTELAVLPRADLDRVLDEAEEALDVARAVEVKRRIDAGEKTMPAAVLKRVLVDGTNAVTAWREYRGLKKGALAKAVGISHSYLWQIETGRRDGSLRIMLAIAEALDTDVEFLVTRAA